MDRLVNDLFTRRLSQIVVLSIFLLVAIAPWVFLLITYLYSQGELSAISGRLPVASFILHALVLPIKDSGAQIGAAFVAAFPGAVAAVCYIARSNGTKLVASQDLNLAGKIASIALILGAIAALLSIVIIGTYPAPVEDIMPDQDDFPVLLKGVFGGLLAFDVLYITTLLGIRNEKGS